MDSECRLCEPAIGLWRPSRGGPPAFRLTVFGDSTQFNLTTNYQLTMIIDTEYC